MNYHGLCTCCSAFFDRPPVPHRNRLTGQIVLLCQECTTSFERESSSLYERAVPLPEGDK